MQTNLATASVPLVDTEACDLTRDPSNRLMLAILEDALVTFQRGLNSPVPWQRRRFHEVDRWVASDDTDWPFSFENICTALMLDPGYIRSGLRKLKKRAFARASRCRPHQLRRERIYDRRGWRGHIR